MSGGGETVKDGAQDLAREYLQHAAGDVLKGAGKAGVGGETVGFILDDVGRALKSPITTGVIIMLTPSRLGTEGEAREATRDLIAEAKKPDAVIESNWGNTSVKIKRDEDGKLRVSDTNGKKTDDEIEAASKQAAMVLQEPVAYNRNDGTPQIAEPPPDAPYWHETPKENAQTPSGDYFIPKNEVCPKPDDSDYFTPNTIPDGGGSCPTPEIDHMPACIDVSGDNAHVTGGDYPQTPAADYYSPDAPVDGEGVCPAPDTTETQPDSGAVGESGHVGGGGETQTPSDYYIMNATVENAGVYQLPDNDGNSGHVSGDCAQTPAGDYYTPDTPAGSDGYCPAPDTHDTQWGGSSPADTAHTGSGDYAQTPAGGSTFTPDTQPESGGSCSVPDTSDTVPGSGSILDGG
jgi:hypothetical protein